MTKGKLIESRSIDYVPRSERHGKVWHLWPVWFMGSAHLATLAVGAIGVAMGGALLWMVIAVVGGCAFGTFFMAFHSTQGPQLGLPQMIQSRPQFGYVGALLVWIVALIAYIGFNAFNQLLAAEAIANLTASPPTTKFVPVLVFAVVAAALAAIGYDWIHRAQRYLAGILIILLTIFSFGAAQRFQFPTADLEIGSFQQKPFLTQFFAAAAYQLSWSIYVSDYSRYLPRDVGVRASFWWTYIGAFVGAAWMMVLGTLAAALNPSMDLTTGMKAAADQAVAGLGRPLLVAALFGLVTISALNFYGASLTFLSALDSLRPLRCTVANRLYSLAAATAISTSVALFSTGHFIERFGALLAVLLYLLTPWTAINLVDFYVVRRGHYSVREIFNPHGLYGRWNWRGLLAYGAGFISMIPFFKAEFYTGAAAQRLGGADVAMMVGLPIAGLTYLLACRSMNLERELQLVAIADQNLEQGPS